MTSSAPIAVEPPAPPERLVELVTAFISWAASDLARGTWHGVDWKELSEDDGCLGQGFCKDASQDLSDWLHLKQVIAAPIGGIAGLDDFAHYPAPEDGLYHWVCVVSIDGVVWAVDLTARQFDRALPFPWIWRWRWKGLAPVSR